MTGTSRRDTLACAAKPEADRVDAVLWREVAVATSGRDRAPLGAVRKRYVGGTHRAVAPEATISRARTKLSGFGVTRVAEITDLDRLGIPVFTAFRPTAPEGAISVYNGKGTSSEEAEGSAVMEAVERASAAVRHDLVSWLSLGEVEREGDRVAPRELILPEGGDSTDRRLAWVRGWDLSTHAPVHLPADAVFYPGGWNERPILRSTSNGLAAGNTLEEAVLHGLCEVIERDALSLHRLRRNGTEVDVSTISDENRALIERFIRAGIEVRVLWITQETRIPTFAVVADDRRARSAAYLTLGAGTHPDRRIALLRAVTENAQSRATMIQGAREDAENRQRVARSRGYEETKARLPHWFGPLGSAVDYGTLPSMGLAADFSEEIRRILTELARAGFGRAVAVDLTRPDIDIPVVRVVVPGLEVCAVDAARVGPRARAAGARAR